MLTPSELHKAVRSTALAYPDSYEESPWGGRVVKVRKKIFLHHTPPERPVRMSFKLPMSGAEALKYPYAEPSHYGMGKHGWVTVDFEAAEVLPPLEIVIDWLDESFRAVAPKTLVKQLPDGPPEPVVETPVPIPDNATVLLVGDDPLRLERAQKALAAVGVGSELVPADAEALDIAGQAGPDVLVIDVNRNAKKVLELAPQLATICFEARILVVGLRDNKMKAAAAGTLPDKAILSREAPGETGVIKLITG